jgi:hypothetical protein
MAGGGTGTQRYGEAGRVLQLAATASRQRFAARCCGKSATLCSSLLRRVDESATLCSSLLRRVGNALQLIAAASQQRFAAHCCGESTTLCSSLLWRVDNALQLAAAARPAACYNSLLRRWLAAPAALQLATLLRDRQRCNSRCCCETSSVATHGAVA